MSTGSLCKLPQVQASRLRSLPNQGKRVHCSVLALWTMATAAIAHHGLLTHSISNFAGIMGPMNPVAELAADDFQKCMAVNSTGVLISTKYELKQMMTQSSIEVEEGRPPQQGAIVNCASINSMFAISGTAAYTASKHAVNGITKAVSITSCSDFTSLIIVTGCNRSASVPRPRQRCVARLSRDSHDPGSSHTTLRRGIPPRCMGAFRSSARAESCV